MYGGLLPYRFALRTLSAPPGLMILGCFAIRVPFYLTAMMKPIARMILMIVDVVANSSKSRLLMFLLLSKADQGINHVKGCAVGLAFRSLFPGSSPGACPAAPAVAWALVVRPGCSFKPDSSHPFRRARQYSPRCRPFPASRQQVPHSRSGQRLRSHPYISSRKSMQSRS